MKSAFRKKVTQVIPCFANKPSALFILILARSLPEAIRNSKTLRDWYRRQLDEAMAMFKINPCDDRMRVMREQMDSYLEAVAMGRVKP